MLEEHKKKTNPKSITIFPIKIAQIMCDRRWLSGNYRCYDQVIAGAVIR